MPEVGPRAFYGDSVMRITANYEEDIKALEKAK